MADGTTNGDTFNGTSADEIYNGLAGDDILYSGGGLDQLFGDEGDDTIILNGPITAGSQFNGGEGSDTIIFSGASTDYAISAVAGHPDRVLVGNALVIGVEHLQFSDDTFHWDTTLGLVADGYLAGATVWIDDGNGILDSYEPFAITDANGNFQLSSHLTGPLLAMGGQTSIPV